MFRHGTVQVRRKYGIFTNSKINNVQRWYGEDIFQNLESQLQKMIYNNAVIFIMLKNFKKHFEFILKAFFVEILR